MSRVRLVVTGARRVPGMLLLKAIAIAVVLGASPAAAQKAADACRNLAACDKQCSTGNGAACARAATMYAAGAGAAKDPMRAFFAFRRGCELNAAEACVGQAELVRDGAGVPRNLLLAEQLFARACELGSVDGCVSAGRSREAGLGGAVDPTRAAADYYRACMQKNPEGCAQIGRLYLWGSGVAADPRAAATSFQIACDKGHGGACGAMALLLERGIGVARNEAKAKKLQAKATGVPLTAPPIATQSAFELSVVSAPANAYVTVDAFDAGRTPTMVRAPAGERIVRISVPGRPPEVRVVRAAAGEKIALRIPFPSLVSLTSSPSGADVTVDGAAAGKTPLELTLPPGDHRVAVSREGFHPKSVVLPVAAATDAKHEIKLAPMNGLLEVTSVPPAAEVWVNGKAVGKTPYSEGLEPGTYKLQVKLAGHLPISKTVTLKRGGTISERLTLEKEQVGLTIDSRPSKAQVTLDGKVVGTTPWAQSLAVGEYSIEVAQTGYEPKTEKIVLASGQKRLQRQFVLSVQPVDLEIVTDPAGADVQINGTLVGKSPHKAAIAPGVHKVSVALDGYGSDKATLKVLPGQPLSKQFVLTSTRGTLEVVTDPAGAEIRVGKTVVGRSPYSGTVAAGTHKLEVSLKGFASEKATLKVGRGQTTSKKFILTTTQAALDLVTDPAGADVTIDGEKAGVTPFTGTVEPGTHRIVLSFAGYDPVEEVVKPRRGERVSRRVVLVSNQGDLDITSEPAGADVLLQGQKVGLTPYRGAVPLGGHRIVVRLHGYEELQDTVTAERGQKVSRQYTLVPQYVPIEVQTEPPGAVITVDDHPRGPAPVKVSLMPGLHKLVATLDDHETARREFTVLPGTPQSQVVKLTAVPKVAPPPAVAVQARAETRPDPMLLQKQLAEINRQEHATLADPKADLETKRAVVVAAVARRGEVALLELVNGVEPAEARAQLCEEHTEKLPKGPLVVTAVDSYDDAVPSEVVVGARVLGQTPLTTTVPLCVRAVEVIHPETKERFRSDVLIDPLKPATVATRYGGRSGIGVLSLFGEYALTDTDWDTFKIGTAGVRHTYYGRVFHSYLALKGGYMSRRGQQDFIRLPLVDASLGVGTVLSPSESFRIHLGTGVGVWSLVTPSARASIGFNIADAVMLDFTGHAHYWLEGINSWSTDYLFFSGNVGLGVVFH